VTARRAQLETISIQPKSPALCVLHQFSINKCCICRVLAVARTRIRLHFRCSKTLSRNAAALTKYKLTATPSAVPREVDTPSQCRPRLGLSLSRSFSASWALATVKEVYPLTKCAQKTAARKASSRATQHISHRSFHLRLCIMERGG